jgi:23S rRNA pseudouridine955/2504/2580 synthase
VAGVQNLTVAEADAGQRLDRWLKRQFPSLNQIRIEKMCRKGEMRVGGARAKPSDRLESGQVVRVPPFEEVARPEKPARVIPSVVSEEDAAMIQACVLFRDDDIIVLNKPAGLATQGGSGQTRHVDLLANALRFGNAEKPKLVHRLDKDTSGLLLLARHGKAATALTRAFTHKSARKIYWALVAGVPAPQSGTIRFGLVKAETGGDGERMQTVHPDQIDSTEGAKPAVTEYTVLETVGQRASWVALSPITGRTHQLRAHMAAIGHPVAGDGKYGSRGQTNEGDGWGAGIGGDISRKMHLHARAISFDHPVTGKRMRFEAPLPPHMERTWAMFDWNPDWAPKDPFADRA